MSSPPTVELYLSGLSALLSNVDGELDDSKTRPLQTWLTRADCKQVDNPSLLKQFCQDLHITPTAGELPLAALSYYFYCGVSPGYVLYIDPVHLKPDRDHLILFGPKSLSLHMNEAKKLRDDVVACYQDLHWEIACCSASSWVLILDKKPDASFSTLADVVGKSIGDYLPAGPDRNYWRNINNEIQMLLHNHPTNLRREQQGQLTANSVWFWGGGNLQLLQKKNTLPKQACRVWTDYSCAAGLAKLAEQEVKELPADAEILLNAESTLATEKIYLDLNDISSTLEGSLTQTEKFNSLLSLWIAPLMVSLSAKKIGQLRLYDDRGRCFSINSRQLKRWWKPVRPISAFF